VRRLLGSQEDVEYVGELKLDGAGIELVYENGWLVVGSTRGDGRVGEDVSTNLRFVPSIPWKLEPRTTEVPLKTAVRGEMILPIHAFERLNAARRTRGGAPFANPRNAAAGALRQFHDIDKKRLGALEFRAYAVVEGLPHDVRTQLQVLARLRAWGFEVSPQARLCPNVEAAVVYHEELLAQRNRLPIECDGAVFKVNRLDLQSELGTLPRSPRWAIAFKFPPAQETTRVEAIEAQVGRTGALTPVARLTPVRVGGVTVSHASLHNQDEVERKDVRVGDTVVVQRAGDVIPQIVGVLHEKRPASTQAYRLPSTCPVCHAATVRLAGEAVTRCPNLDCPAQLKNNLLHLASRAALDIDGLGEKLVEQLVERGFVRQLSDLFRLEPTTLAALERMGEKSTANLMASLARARNTTLPRFLIALGMRHVGSSIAELLASHFGDLEGLLRASREEIEAVPGIGPTIAESVQRFFADPRNQAEIRRLHELGVRWPSAERAPRREGPLVGKKLVLTGSLSGFSREETKQRIEAAGGHVVSSISKQTDYVVVGAEPGSKLRRAQELKIPLLDQATLETLLTQ